MDSRSVGMVFHHYLCLSGLVGMIFKHEWRIQSFHNLYIKLLYILIIFDDPNHNHYCAQINAHGNDQFKKKNRQKKNSFKFIKKIF